MSIIDLTSENTAESVDMISLKSEHKICSNCADKVSGASVAWISDGISTISMVEDRMCIPMNESNDIDEIECTKRSICGTSSSVILTLEKIVSYSISSYV